MLSSSVSPAIGSTTIHVPLSFSAFLIRLASLVIAEAPAPDVLRACDEMSHYRSFREMTDRYFAAYQRGNLDAIADMIDFYGGAGTFASWPPRVRDYVVATTPANTSTGRAPTASHCRRGCSSDSTSRRRCVRRRQPSRSQARERTPEHPHARRPTAEDKRCETMLLQSLKHMLQELTIVWAAVIRVHGNWLPHPGAASIFRLVYLVVRVDPLESHRPPRSG